jgi:hypothetical protein
MGWANSYAGWTDQIYIYHDFGHPKYNVFVGDEEQTKHEDGIKLR